MVLRHNTTQRPVPGPACRQTHPAPRTARCAGAPPVHHLAGELTSEEEALLKALLAKQQQAKKTTPTTPTPNPSLAAAGEVEMYEDGGTLVIKTAGGQGDVAIDGTRVAAALEALHQAHAALVTRFDATETKNSQLEARVNATEAKNANLEARVNATEAKNANLEAALAASANNATAAVAELRLDHARAFVERPRRRDVVVERARCRSRARNRTTSDAMVFYRRRRAAALRRLRRVRSHTMPRCRVAPSSRRARRRARPRTCARHDTRGDARRHRRRAPLAPRASLSAARTTRRVLA